jgi:hypothetical protein
MPQISIFEWLMSFLLFVVGIHILMLAGSVSSSHMRLILHVLDQSAFGSICLTVGVFRLSVLTLNARLGRRCRDFRIMGAIAASIIWLEMVVAFASRLWIDALAVPPGLDMLAAQFIGEIWLVYRLAKSG